MKFGSEVKQHYIHYHDSIFKKRYNSPFWIRRYAHRHIYEQFLRYIPSGAKVLDAGCGEGILSALMAQQGAIVTGVDISYLNISAARCLAHNRRVDVQFFVADIENLPFPDNSYDIVVCSHVIEHLPNIDRGLKELYRVTKTTAIIAIPTCLNLASLVLLGGDNYWKISKRSLVAIPIGLVKTFVSWMRGQLGPNEGYNANKQLPHIWFFPWTIRALIENIGFKIKCYESGPLLIPYLAQYFTVFRSWQINLDKKLSSTFLRHFGFGSMIICSKRDQL